MFNKYFDHTLLKPEATLSQIEELCRQALEYDFYSVCVNSCNVKAASEFLKDSHVAVCTVIGFPLGACTTASKVFETEDAIRSGATEVDMVINVGRLKDRDYDYVKEDIAAVAKAAHARSVLLKVIIETCLLTDEEIVQACKLAQAAGADFVKTSTGFSTGGATAHDVALMKETVGHTMKVKASGGIRDLAKTLEMINAGADRIGASASVDIIKAYSQNND